MATRNDYIQVTIDRDPMTLGSEATEADLASYALQLSSELTEEFGVEVQVVTGSISRSRVAATHPSLNDLVDQVENRVREIESGDEWIEIQRRSAS